MISANPAANKKLELRSIGSGVLIKKGEHNLIVTCEHVINKGQERYCGAGRLERPSVPDNPKQHAVGPAKLVATNVGADLALLKNGSISYSGSQKTYYDLNRSNFVSENHMQSQLGTASFILGYWGEMGRAYAYEDGLFYLEAPLYSAIGPLCKVNVNELLANIAEKEVLFKNVKDFPQIAPHVPSGGARDLSGISGSGLWMMTQGRPVLVGIVLGRSHGTADQHLIRVTPIWVLRDWMNSLSLA